MKRVLIIYTGGTIGMTRTENGYAPRAGYFRAGTRRHPRPPRTGNAGSGSSVSSHRCWTRPT